MNYVSCVSDGSSEDRCFKRTWTPKEDATIQQMVSQHGASNWSLIAGGLIARSGKQCRERYHNHLQPDVKKGEWSEEEDQLIVVLQAKYGNQWAKITKELPGRTDNAVKNRWHAAMRCKGRVVEIQQSNVSIKVSPKVSKAQIPTLALHKAVSRNTEMKSSSGSLSARRQIPSTIEEIVRKYSPRFESEMQLSDSVDLNMVSHGHHMHDHVQNTARSNVTCDNTPRFSPRVAYTPVAEDRGSRLSALSSLMLVTSAKEESPADADDLSDEDIEVLSSFMEVDANLLDSDDYLINWANMDDDNQSNHSASTAGAFASTGSTTGGYDDMFMMEEDNNDFDAYCHASSGAKISPRLQTSSQRKGAIKVKGNKKNNNELKRQYAAADNSPMPSPCSKKQNTGLFNYSEMYSEFDNIEMFYDMAV